VEAELDRLHSTGVITPVTFSRWAAPIVPVIKSSGEIRICGDYKTTVNQVATPDKYPLPRVDELFAAMSGGSYFTKLDLSHAYQQLVLDDESQELVTINTSKGLYRYTRLPFGVSAAPSIFQRTMDSLLADIPKAVAFLDDILITGSNEAEHWANVEAVLTKLEEAGLRLKRDKCVFGVREVVYLGHRINSDGIQPTTDKVDAVLNAPVPNNVSELKSYLGLLNFYAKFLPHLSSTLAPLHNLLRKDVQWSWGPQQDAAFQTSKQHLVSAEVLVHFDPKKDLILSCDASPYGLGVVLAHRMPDGTERPVAYASRSLSPAERNYAHLDKEGVAVIYGVKKFHQYLYGRPFTITTDHKPLLGLFGESRAVPPMASSRIQRWGLTLSAYQYKLVYRPGVANCNADGLSRLPLPDAPSHTPEPHDYVLVMDHLESTTVNPDKIRLWTGRDPVLSQVREYVMNGWPRSCRDNDLKPYSTRADELSVQSGCVMWGSRVIVPPQGRQYIMNELHEAHPGISKMKALARSYVWWPNMDQELEDKVKHCGQCQVHRKAPPLAPLHPWEWPNEPWERLHLDYAGPFMGHMFLIVVDAHSKWIDVHIVNRATTSATVEKLRTTFATHGLPRVIVTDNGSNFTSEEFADFMTQNGIKHVKSAPFHPSSNGLAERAVQSFKNGMKKMGEGSVETKLSRYLMRYRITPHTTTGASPAELLMKRKPRCKLDLVRPNMASHVREKQMDQKANHDKRTKLRTFQVDDTVYAKNFARGPLWVPGHIISSNGPLSYSVKLHDGRVWKRHVDHVRARSQNDQTCNVPPAGDHDWDLAVAPPGEEGNVVIDPGHGQVIHPSGERQSGQSSRSVRQSKRSTKPPARYGWDS
jgi:transposase InsO family protein